MAVLQKNKSIRRVCLNTRIKTAMEKIFPHTGSGYLAIVVLILGMTMILAFAVPAQAESRNGIYILDEKEYLTESEWQSYQARAKELSDKLNMDILYVQTYHKDLQTDAQSLNLGSRSNQIMLLDNDGSCDIALFGTANALNQEHIQQLRNAYIVKPTYTEGVAAYLATAEQIVTDLNNSGAFAQNCDDSISNDQISEPNDVDDVPEKSFPLGKWLLIFLITGAIVAGGVVLYIKRRRKSLQTPDPVTSNTQFSGSDS